MQDNLEKVGAGALLRSTQQLRVHWSGIIVSLINYTVIINLAIWSYFLKVYFDSPQASYIAIATASSAIVIGFWRWYTHYIDNSIAGLYPDFLLAESRLGVPPGYGTSAYLIRSVPRIRGILSDIDLTPERIEAIKTLVSLRQIGSRGHLWFDFFSLVILVGYALLLAFILPRSKILIVPTVIGFGGIGVGLFLILWGNRSYQKEPSERCIKRIRSKLKEKGSNE